MESYKQEKIIIIMYEYLNDKREFYPISNVPLDKAKFFYKDDDGLFKLMAVSDYTVKTELNENRLYIVNAAIKDNSEKFQIGYEINFKAAEYESPLPVLSVLTKMYNQLIEDTRILHSYIRKQCFVADGKEQALVLPGLPAHTVWCMGENGKMFALPISELYGKFNQMIEEIRKVLNDLSNKDLTEKTKKILEKLRTETDKLLEELNQASVGLPKRVAALENKTTQDRKELEDLINTSRTENIQPSRIIDNSISSSKLKIATDEDKIKLVNLSDEVKKAMTGNTPVSPTLQKDSVVREYIADEAINGNKIERESLTTNLFSNEVVFFKRKDGSNICNPDEVVNQYLKPDGTIVTESPGARFLTGYMYVGDCKQITVDHQDDNDFKFYSGCWYDSQKKYIRGLELSDRSEQLSDRDIINIPIGAMYYRKNFFRKGDPKQWKVLKGSVPYIETQYSEEVNLSKGYFTLPEDKLIYDSINKQSVYIAGDGKGSQVSPPFRNKHVPFILYLEHYGINKTDKLEIEFNFSTDDKNVKGVCVGYYGSGEFIEIKEKNTKVHIKHKITTEYQTYPATRQITVGVAITSVKDGLWVSAIFNNIIVKINDKVIPYKAVPERYDGTIYKRELGFKEYMIVPFDTLKPSTRAVIESKRNYLNSSSWGNIKWGAIGDSITEVNFRAKRGYLLHIKDMTNINFTNLGTSAVGYHKTPDGFLAKINAIKDGDYDIVTIFGGVNDREFFRVAKGEITDGLQGEKDTFCGRVNEVLKIGSQWVKTKLLVIGPLPTAKDNLHNELLGLEGDANGYKLKGIDETLKELCKIWNIPYLSLFTKGVLKPWIESQNNEFFFPDGKGVENMESVTADGLHPNTKGLKIIADIIWNFIKSNYAQENFWVKSNDENFYIPSEE